MNLIEKIKQQIMNEPGINNSVTCDLIEFIEREEAKISIIHLVDLEKVIHSNPAIEKIYQTNGKFHRCINFIRHTPMDLKKLLLLIIQLIKEG